MAKRVSWKTLILILVIILVIGLFLILLKEMTEKEYDTVYCEEKLSECRAYSCINEKEIRLPLRDVNYGKEPNRDVLQNANFDVEVDGTVGDYNVCYTEFKKQGYSEFECEMIRVINLIDETAPRKMKISCSCDYIG